MDRRQCLHRFFGENKGTVRLQIAHTCELIRTLLLLPTVFSPPFNQYTISSALNISTSLSQINTEHGHRCEGFEGALKQSYH